MGIKIKYKVSTEFMDLETWVSQLHSNFPHSGESIFKYRNEVKVFSVGDYELNVKAFKIPNLINRFVYIYIRGSKAARSYRYARKFLALGIATPAAVGYVECTSFGLLRESYYVSVHYKNEFTLREVLSRNIINLLI